MAFRINEDYLASVTEPSSTVVSLDDRRKENEALIETQLLDAGITNVARHLQALEQELAYLCGAVEEDTLASAVIGSLGNDAGVMRQKLPTLRQALRDGGAAA